MKHTSTKIRSLFYTNALCAVFLLPVLFGGCGANSDPGAAYYEEVSGLDMPEYVKDSYVESSSKLEDMELAIKTFNLTHSEEDFSNLYGLYQALDFSYDKEDMEAEASKFCAAHKFRVDSMRFVARELLETGLAYVQQTIVNEDDKLLNETTTYPFYLPKGTTLYIDYETSTAINTKLYNADSYSTIRSWNGKSAVHDSIVVSNGAVYVWEVSPKSAQYITATLKHNCKSLDEFGKKHDIREETVECKAGAPFAKKIEAIAINSVFEEPRKVTLRSQGKAFFSGGSRSVVTMQVPANCTDMLYSLRISTSQTDVGDDGQFCKKVNEKYHKIKFLGLPLYESQKTGSNLFRELLNASEPMREEEAYCNLYVFTDSKQAKKFMDGGAVSELKYNVDLSKQGTQSCNDRIPTKGMKTVYFGFENTRVRYSVYLWLESVATVKKTEYVQSKYVRDDD